MRLSDIFQSNYRSYSFTKNQDTSNSPIEQSPKKLKKRNQKL